MQMPTRKYSATTSTTYRFGFNGKEDDKDINIGVQDYGMRIYDSRLGRFLSIDPLIEEYPWYTPYQFSGNTPIQAIDLDGGEPKWMVNNLGRLTRPMMTLLSSALNYHKRAMFTTFFVHKKSGPKYMGNTILNFVIHDKRKTNFYELTDPAEWVNFWIDLVFHEIKHRSDYQEFTNVGFGIKYVADLIKFGGYSKKSFFELRAYALDGPVSAGIMNFENGLAIKTLESSLSDNDKSAVLEYVGTKYRLGQEKKSLNELKLKSSEDDLITKKEARKIRRLERKVENTAKRVTELYTDKVKNIAENMNNVKREEVKEYSQEKKEAMQKTFEK
jgi:RHS repeat-associated protein